MPSLAKLCAFKKAMPVNKEAYQQIIAELDAKNVKLVAVSKTRPAEEIMEMYRLGQRDFGENYVQEMVDKAAVLPKDIRWHFIGHLQSNKVKYIAPFVSVIHGVDSLKLLQEINKQAAKNGRVIDCLLQVHIAREESKFGLDEAELNLVVQQAGSLELFNVRVIGLMGMASFTDDLPVVKNEFRELKRIFEKFATIANNLPGDIFAFSQLSMGMSSDYHIAIEEGSTMLRIGSLLFGAREYDE